MPQAILIVLVLALIAILWFSGASFLQPPTKNIGIIPETPENETVFDSSSANKSAETSEHPQTVRVYNANLYSDKAEEEYIEIQGAREK